MVLDKLCHENVEETGEGEYEEEEEEESFPVSRQTIL